MPEFKFIAAVTVSAFTTVVADTLVDAFEEASTRECVIGNPLESRLRSWIVWAADGEAENIRLISSK
jgi:hypothetical protein